MTPPLALTALLALSGAVPQGHQIFPYPLRIEKLKNGLTLVRVPFKSPGLVAYYTVLRVGSRNEVEPGHTGFAHFFEHTMFKGTPAHPEGTREASLGKLGFDDNAFTTDDVTVYHSFGPSAALQLLIALEADRFKHLKYSEEAFQTEAKAVLGEYHTNAAHPALKIEEELHATAFTQHTYRHTTLGFYADIQKMPERYQYSLDFFRNWYQPDNAMIFVAGDFDDAKLTQWVREAYSDWKGTAAKIQVPIEPAQRQERQVHIDWPTPTRPRHLLAWHVPGSASNQRAAAIQSVLGQYLAGETSPLYKEMVLEKQLVESIGPRADVHRDPFLLIVTATLKQENARAEVQRAIDRRVEELSNGRVDAKRVADIKAHLRYQLLMALTTADDVGRSLAYFAGVFGNPRALEQQSEEVAKVRPVDLANFAKKYLTPTNRTVVTFSSGSSSTPAPGAKQ